MRIVMTRTAKGADDGFTVREYVEGEAYDVSDDLAQAFFQMGAADPQEAHEAADAAEAPSDASDPSQPATRVRKGRSKAST